MSDFQRRTRELVFGSGCPATVALILANIITFFTRAILLDRDPLLPSLLFVSPSWLRHPWTLVTWPLEGASHPFNLLLVGFWAFWVCGSLERSWGTRTFLSFFFATAALTAFTTWVGTLLLAWPMPIALFGLYYGIAAPTVAWCTINRRETISLFGILPIPAPLLGWLTVVIVWYEVGTPLIGLFALSGCAAAYWYAQYGRYRFRGYAPARNLFGGGRRATSAPPLRLHHFDRENESAGKPGFSLRRWYTARQERRKLEALWKRSRSSESEDRDNRR